MLRNLLIYRFVILNALALSLMWWLASFGHVQAVIEGDKSQIVFGIAALFVVAWLWTARRVVRTSRRLNQTKANLVGGAARRQAMLEVERDKDLAKIEWLGDVSGWLVGLGLLGTVVGFSIALSGIDPNSLAQASGVQQGVATLMLGMRVALYTTLAGGVLGMWNEVNHRMLKTALTSLWADTIRQQAG